MRTAIVLSLVAIGTAVHAEPIAPETLLQGEIEHGGYGGPRVSFGRVAGHDALLVGFEGGWIVNHNFILGAAGYGLVTDQPAPGTFATTDHLTMGYGGALLGYTLLPQRLVHATLTVLIGGGGLGRRAGDHDTINLGDAFFVLEPAATMEMNITEFFHFGVTLSYRWVRSVDTSGITNKDLSGAFASLGLKFGKF